MKARLLKLADALSGSYWFLPTLMASAAFLLAGGMVWIDSHVGSDWMDGLPWLYAARPDGARQLLSVIAGSMITVAGTVFSITIAAVVYASGQYGPRLLSNYMANRGNQVTLGTFIATFLYGLIVLRTIRSAEEIGGGGYVPNLALAVAVILAVCSIAVLIFFIHHVPNELHINSVIENVGRGLLREIDQRFPKFIGEPRQPDAPPSRAAAAFSDRLNDQPFEPVAIRSNVTGYIQFIDHAALLGQAEARDLVLRLQYQPGDFIHVGRTIVEAWPPEACSEAAGEAIRAAVAVGARRTALQDLRFLIDELVEIAARALSPGVNDPFTAVTCLDWLGAAISDLAERELPSHLRAGEDGELRVIAHPETFERFATRAFGPLAQYCARDRVAALGYIRALGEASLGEGSSERMEVLSQLAQAFGALCEKALDGEDRALAAQRLAELRRALGRPAYRRSLRDSAAWLGGTA